MFTLFEFQQVYNQLDVLFNKSGNVKWNKDLACCDFSENSQITTVEYFPYVPGKSNLILFTAIIGNGENRIGVFDEYSGLFFKSGAKQNNSNISFNVRLNGTDQSIKSRDFNGDPEILNTIDYTKAHIFYIRFLWLGVGNIEFGIVRNSEFKLLHKIDNYNKLDNVYMKRASLPFSVNCDSGTCKLISATIISEGNSEIPQGYPYTCSNTTIPVNISNKELSPIISIRYSPTFQNDINHIFVKMNSFSIMSNRDIYYTLLYNPKLDNPMWTDVDTNKSGIQYDIISKKILDNGNLIHSGFCNSINNNNNVFQEKIMNKFPMGLDRIITIAAKTVCTTTKTATCFGGFNWWEIY